MENENIEILFSGIKKGDIEDFEKVFNIYFPKLMYYATQFLSKDEAEDIVQDVFVDLWSKRDQLEFGKAIVSFLYQLVHNKSLNRIKHKQIVQGYCTQFEIMSKKLEYYSPDENEIFQNLIKEERFSALKSAINSLPEKSRKCFKLSYIYGMKSKDIAELMGISVRTVETHIYKSLHTLRKRFKDVDLAIFAFLYILFR